MPSPWSESANSVAETAPRMIWSVVVSVFPEMAKLDISTLTNLDVEGLGEWVSLPDDGESYLAGNQPPRKAEVSLITTRFVFSKASS